MSELHIISNYHRRDILWWWDLTEEEQKEFDWIDSKIEVFYQFVRYRGNAYCLADFMRTDDHRDPEFRWWDGYSSDSFFSGVLIKWPIDEFGDPEEGIIMGWYYC